MLPSSRRLLAPSNIRVCARCLSTASKSTPSFAIKSRQRSTPLHLRSTSNSINARAISTRTFSTSGSLRASHTTADSIVEKIESLYGDAKEEFEMAAEETEENTIYAADDRAEAQRLVDELQAYYAGIVGEESQYPEDIKKEVRRRADTRVREIVNAMTALEEKAMSHD